MKSSASKESPANDEWKQTILRSGESDTSLLPLGKMSMRVISNEKLKKLTQEKTIPLEEAYSLMSAPDAWNAGDFDLFPAGAGQVCALINEIKSVREIVEEMVS